MPAGETAFLSMKKVKTNFAFTDDRGTDSLDKDSLKQLKIQVTIKLSVVNL